MTNENVINVIFNPGKGRCEIRTCEAVYGELIPKLPKARREGYTFTGWYADRTCTEKIKDGDVVTFSSDITLYAGWARKDRVDSITEKRKNKTMLRRQKTIIAVLAVTMVLLVSALFVANYFMEIYTFDDLDGTRYYVKKFDGEYALCFKGGAVCDRNDEGYYQTTLGTQVIVDKKSGECQIYAVVDTEGTELLGFSNRVLMFKQLTYDESSTKDASRVIKSVEIHNEYGSFTFERNKDMDFVIKGHEGTPYNRESFAKLAVACGYTISVRRLENPQRLGDGSINYAEYGLADEIRTRIETDDDGNEVEKEYNYTPSWYVITTMTGESHKVIVGDAVVSGTGYYAKYEGRDTIYILGSNGFSDVVLQKIEDMVTPMVIYPMESNLYFDVEDFRIYKNIDYKAIEESIIKDYPNFTELDEEKQTEIYFELFEKHSKKMCDFSYQPLNERTNSMYATLPYISNLEYSGGYYINSTNISNMLSSLYRGEFEGVVKLAPTDEDLEKYGLDYAEFVVEFLYRTTDDDGEEIYIANRFDISAKTADGKYYAYSEMYDMIVVADEAIFDYLDWQEIDWYEPSYIQSDITFIKDIIVESPKYGVHFKFENSASKVGDYFAHVGNEYKDSKGNVFKIRKNADGKYVLIQGDKELSPVYNGDYLLAALPYSEGKNEYGDYAIVETISSDSDGDGNNDTVTYYYYYVYRTSNGYSLAATVVTSDMYGNRIAQDKTIQGQPHFSSDYFITSNGYMYFAYEDSYIGKHLNDKYKNYGNGSWHTGNVFITADNSYILVDKQTGVWAELKSVSEGIYFGDKNNSMLAKSGVSNNPQYNSAGQLVRPVETYYATTYEKLRYNDEHSKVQVYDSTANEWKNATFDDCTIGVWNTGAYYLTENGEFIVVNSETGDWGIMTLSNLDSSNAYVFADGKQLDYSVKLQLVSGKVQDSTAVDNFRQFYKGLLYASIEGMADLNEKEMADLRALDKFSGDDADERCRLKLTILARDNSGNVRNMVYRFYRYSERRSYLTIEVLSENGELIEDSNNAYGNFYVLNSFVDKIVSDSEKIATGKPVVAVTKY